MQLTENPDIVTQVCQLAQRPIVVAFAAQTHEVNAKAIAKMKQKKCDMIVANYVNQAKNIGFNANTLSATIHWKTGQLKLETQSKHAIATHLFHLIEQHHPHQETIDA